MLPDNRTSVENKMKFKCLCGCERYNLTEIVWSDNISCEPNEVQWNVDIPIVFFGQAECLGCKLSWKSLISDDHLQDKMIVAGVLHEKV